MLKNGRFVLNEFDLLDMWNRLALLDGFAVVVQFENTGFISHTARFCIDVAQAQNDRNRIASLPYHCQILTKVIAILVCQAPNPPQEDSEDEPRQQQMCSVLFS